MIDDFLQWARASVVPFSLASADHRSLDALGKLVGDATIVALTEGVHGAAEPLEFRNLVIQYLVKEMGFTAVALESGIVEGRRLLDYVLGDNQNLAAAMRDGMSWTFERLPQNNLLIRWLRDYNSSQMTLPRVRLYGFDVPGSPGEPAANRGLTTALLQVLKFLREVDDAIAMDFSARLATFLHCSRLDLRRQDEGPCYQKFDQGQRDALTATIADLIKHMEVKEAIYTSASSIPDYAWAYRAAIGARQVDGWLRQLPLAWNSLADPGSPQSELNKFLATAGDVRDRAQADNLEWIVEQEGINGKVIVFAHRYHLSNAPLSTDRFGSREQQVMGTYMKRRFGTQLITIGNLIGGGEVECGGIKCCDGFKQALGQPPLRSIEQIAGEVGVPQYLLDLRKAPMPVARWLESVTCLGRGTLGHGQDQLDVPVGRAFDALYYLSAVRSACCDGLTPVESLSEQ